MIKYTKGYQYQLAEDCVTLTGLSVPRAIEQPYFTLHPDGTLHIRKGYAWDGATGAADTKTILRASLVHDVFYQLIGMGYISRLCRKQADAELYRLCREDGMGWVRAQWVYRAVRLYGKINPDPEGSRTVRTAP